MPGKYIAVLTGKGELDPDTLNNINTFTGLWQEWKGQDGLGFEQIFLLTTDKYNPEFLLPAPSDSKNETEYRPDHGLHEDAPGTTWCDGPQIPTKEYPYCW
jgi:hypothetical protein